MSNVTNLILSSNPIYKNILDPLNKKTSCNWEYIDNKKKFSNEYLNFRGIKKIFIPHWSFVIPKNIHKNYECILFHMTDLPYGRGGSPLQNLIKRGYHDTKISAIRVNEQIDSGPIYLKKKLSLEGTAGEIFNRSSLIIEKMIIEILNKNPDPKPQIGTPTYFTRRTPAQSNISGISSLEDFYDQIRMLDFEGYPKAFLEFENFKIELNNATFKDKKNLIANVRIFKK